MSHNTEETEEATDQEWLDFARVWCEHGQLESFEVDVALSTQIKVPLSKEHQFSYRLKFISLGCVIELIFDGPDLVTVGSNGAAAENPYLSKSFSASYKGSLFVDIRVWNSKSGDTYIIIDIDREIKTWTEKKVQREKIFVKNPFLAAVTY